MITSIKQHQISGIVPDYRNKNSFDISRFSIPAKRGQTPTTDTISLRGESAPAATYSCAMRSAGNDDAKFSMLRNLVVNLLQKQGINTKIAAGDNAIDLAALTPQQAQELVSEDGYFGVEKTAERIVQFAVSIAGGDPARIDAIKAGIDRGFAEAKQAFGGWLPDISYDTYDAVMQKLDEWAASKTVAV